MYVLYVCICLCMHTLQVHTPQFFFPPASALSALYRPVIGRCSLRRWPLPCVSTLALAARRLKKSYRLRAGNEYGSGSAGTTRQSGKVALR